MKKGTHATHKKILNLSASLSRLNQPRVQTLVASMYLLWVELAALKSYVFEWALQQGRRLLTTECLEDIATPFRYS